MVVGVVLFICVLYFMYSLCNLLDNLVCRHSIFRCRFLLIFFFFFKQKTAYEMRISDWSSDVCSSDLGNIFFMSIITFSIRSDTSNSVMLPPSWHSLREISLMIGLRGSPMV